MPKTRTTRKARKPEDVIERGDDYIKHYVTNVMVHPTDVDIRFDVFNEKIAHGKHFDLIADAGVILTPEAAVILRNQLDAAIKDFEKSHGPVTLSKSRTVPISTRGAPVDT